MLIKRKIIERDEDDSVSSQHSANSDVPRNELNKLAELKQQSLLGVGTNSMKVLDRINLGIQNCKQQTGVLDPQKMFELLNEIQKKEDPDAYQPEIIKTIQQREKKKQEQDLLDEKRRLDELERRRKQEEHEKALFDFDQDIDDLEQVEERYPMLKLKITTDPGHEDQTCDADKENKNAGNTEVKVSKEPEQVKTKVPMMYQVKRTERPAFSSDILADLARIKA